MSKAQSHKETFFFFLLKDTASSWSERGCGRSGEQLARGRASSRRSLKALGGQTKASVLNLAGVGRESKEET